MNTVKSEIEKTSENEKGKDNIEVWEDIVSIKDLVTSLIICSAMTLGGYFLAPKQPPKPLFFGLGCALLGFIICTIIIKPKRIFEEIHQED